MRKKTLQNYLHQFQLSKCRKYSKFYSLFLLILAIGVFQTSFVSAQKFTISGNITDAVTARKGQVLCNRDCSNAWNN
jgi:hypothetical protein